MSAAKVCKTTKAVLEIELIDDFDLTFGIDWIYNFNPQRDANGVDTKRP